MVWYGKILEPSYFCPFFLCAALELLFLSHYWWVVVVVVFFVFFSVFFVCLSQ